MSEAQEIQDLKDQVARLTRLVEALWSKTGEPMPDLTVSLDAPPADVVGELQAGRMINAIKLWRDYTGLGLAEAKAEMETLAARLGV
jgi:ribosomal protein L7/L12